MTPVLDAGARLYEAAWELRRAVYAAGWRRPRAAGARVVSIGNLTVGGTGKTTLTLHLAHAAIARSLRVAVVCRDYRPGPDGLGDEALLLRAALGEGRLFHGHHKGRLARRAAAAGNELVLVDDGFSHWGLARDLDIVLLDAGDPWGGGALLPRGRLREPHRALQRADIVVVSRVPGAEAVESAMDAVRPWAPGALFAAGRHEVTGARRLDGTPMPERGPARVVTATGNPAAVGASAAEAGFHPVVVSAYRDHHWFRPGEARAEVAAAEAAGASVVLTSKDAPRWPREAGAARVAVLEVRWAWLNGGAEVERRVFGDGDSR